MPMTTVLQLENGPEVAVGVFDLVIDPRGARRVVAIHERVPPVISAVPADGGGLWLGTLSGLYRSDAEGRVSGRIVWPPRGSGVAHRLTVPRSVR